jgi:hypothetical protein
MFAKLEILLAWLCLLSAACASDIVFTPTGADDTAAIQAAIVSCKADDTLILRSGTSLASKTITIDKPLYVRAEGFSLEARHTGDVLVIGVTGKRLTNVSWNGGRIQRSDAYAYGRGVVLRNVCSSDIAMQQSYRNSPHITLSVDDACAYNRVTIRSCIHGAVGVSAECLSSNAWINANTFTGCGFGLDAGGCFVSFPQFTTWNPDGMTFNACQFEGGAKCTLLNLANVYSRITFRDCWLESTGMTVGTFAGTNQINIITPSPLNGVAKAWKKTGLVVSY